VDSSGEHFVYDRAHAIAELLKSDRPEPLPTISNTYNIHDSNFINSSPGASITQNAELKSGELLALLAELKKLSGAAELSHESRAQMNADINTIELQNFFLTPTEPA